VRYQILYITLHTLHYITNQNTASFNIFKS